MYDYVISEFVFLCKNCLYYSQEYLLQQVL